MFSLEQLWFLQHVGRHDGSTVQDDNNIFIEDNEPMSSLVVVFFKLNF